MKKTVIIIAVLIAVGAIGAYFYVFHKPHRNIADEKADFTESAPALVEAFNSDAEAANAKYLDQVLEVKGVAMEIDNEHVMLDGGVYCAWAQDTERPALQEGDEITVKGRVVSYDELFGEVRMDFCKIAQ